MLSDDFELDKIEENNSKKFEGHDISIFQKQKKDENSCHSYLDKPNLHHFACCVIIDN